MTQYISPRTASAIFLLAILIGAGTTALTLARANTTLPAEPTSPEAQPAEVVRVLDEHALHTDTLSEQAPYVPAQHDPVGDQSLNAKIARMIAVALQLRPQGPVVAQGSGTYSQVGLDRVLDIARRNNENTRTSASDSVSDLSSSLTQGGSFSDPALTNADITTLTVSGSTRFNDPLTLAQTSVPASTTDKLYNLGGDLYWADNPVSSAAVGQWASDGTNVWRAGGRIGIGTSSPAGPLDVYDLGITRLFLDSTSVIGRDLTGRMFFAPASAGELYITPDGEVGIGNSGGHNVSLTVTSKFSSSTPVAEFKGSSSGDAFIRVMTTNTIYPEAGIRFGRGGALVDYGRITYNSLQHRMDFTANNNVRLSINSSGDIGIGTSTPWRKLSVAGTVAFGGLTTAGASSDALCLATSGEVVVNTGAQDCTVSSERFKHTIQQLTLDEADSIASALSPVAFRYNDTDEPRLGLIAEEVAQVDERLIFREADGRPRGVRYGDIVAVLLAAFQKQKVELALLAERVGETAATTFDTFFVRKIVVDLGEFERIVAREELRSDGRLCIGSTCITEADLQAFLAEQGRSAPSASVAPAPTPTPVEDMSEVTEDTDEPKMPVEEVSAPDEPEVLVEEDVPDEESAVSDVSETDLTTDEPEPTEA